VLLEGRKISVDGKEAIKHSCDRAIGPRYKRDARLHPAAPGASSVMALGHPTAAAQHLEGPGTLQGPVSQPHSSGNLT